MSRVLKSNFFNRHATHVGKDLLGAILVRRDGEDTERHIITEVEAYIGPEDRASHAFHGRTSRNDALFGNPGIFYVYLVYGMHHMLSVVTGPSGFPAAVFIRGVEKIYGPARITKALSIGTSFNATYASVRGGLWFEEGETRPRKKHIKSLPRIGVDFSGNEWSKKPLRFRVEGEK